MTEQLSLGPLFHKKKKSYGLHRNFMPKNKRWLLDCDYVDSLSDYDKAWLDQFNREFVEGAIKKGDGTALHYTDDLRKAAYRENTCRTRDLFAIKQCGNAIDELVPWMKIEYNNGDLDGEIDSRRLHHSEVEIFIKFCFCIEL